MAGTTFSQFTPIGVFPSNGDGTNGTPNTTNMVLMSTGAGGNVWTVVPIVAGGTGQTTAQTGLDALANPSNLNLGGNIVMSAGKRIRGDLSNGTVATRVAFQTSTANSPTYLTAIPNGNVASGAYASALDLHDNTSAAGNGSVFSISNIQGTEMRFHSTVVGSGTLRPVTFYFGNKQVVSMHVGGTSTTQTSNVTLAGNAGIDLVLTPQTANAWTALSVVDNGGNPHTHFRTARSASVIYMDFHTFYLRNVAGSSLLTVGNSGQIGFGAAGVTGTAGEFLQSNGPNAAPSWTANLPSSATGTTQPPGTNNTTFATTAFVQSSISTGTCANAGYATNANYATTAGSANTANSATNATNATNATYATYLGGALSDVNATANTIAKRSGDGSLYATYLYGTATRAQYADLAEVYSTDAEYPVGTVIVVSGDDNVDCTQTTEIAQYVLGVVSTNPAHLMNAEAEGQAIALTGRVPVRVIGPVRKGMRIASSNIPGVAMEGLSQPFGIALETNLDMGEKLVECVVK